MTVGHSFAQPALSDPLEKTEPQTWAMRGLFEQIVYHVFAWAAPLAGGYICYRLLAYLPDIGPGWLFISPIAVTYFSYLALQIFCVDSKKYPQVELWLRRMSRTWGYPIVLALGLASGWEYRHLNSPDVIRERAITALAESCSGFEQCVQATGEVEGKELFVIQTKVRRAYEAQPHRHK